MELDADQLSHALLLHQDLRPNEIPDSRRVDGLEDAESSRSVRDRGVSLPFLAMELFADILPLTPDSLRYTRLRCSPFLNFRRRTQRGT